MKLVFIARKILVRYYVFTERGRLVASIGVVVFFVNSFYGVIGIFRIVVKFGFFV